jgi:glycine/D-amino acid oxidase-like deaminating enzyme
VKQFFNDLEVDPGRGLVLVTTPINNLKIKGSFHYEEGYYYFRNFENRIILGGGRNLDVKTETTTDFGINALIKEKLLYDLKSFIHPNSPVEIEGEWSGIMAFGKNKIPLVEKRGDHLALGVRLGGMGIAIGSVIGKQTAELLKD